MTVAALLILALFFPGLERTLFLKIAVLGLMGVLLFTLLPRIHLPKLPRHPAKPRQKKSSPSPSDDMRTAFLCQLSHRITDKLRSAYGDATWEWCHQPNVERLLMGKTERITLSHVPEFTHAEISMDTFGALHIQLLKLQAFAQAPGPDANPPKEPPVVDCSAWYELVGESLLSRLVTDLNARGYSKLTILENGDITILEADEPVVKETFDQFPGKTYWNELASIFTENGLKAAVTDTALELSW